MSLVKLALDQQPKTGIAGFTQRHPILTAGIALTGGLAAAEDDGNNASATQRLVSGYMPKIGKPRKKGSCYMCTVCECLVQHEETNHRFTLAHRDAEDRLQLAQLEAHVVRKQEAARNLLVEVGDWVVVTSRKAKQTCGSLKDQAGHPSS